ncbi:MAG: hypothetical protein UY22_C0043G0016, partial [Candidatus Amesbacteria bacterium GW2011_GWC1_48_10]
MFTPEQRQKIAPVPNDLADEELEEELTTLAEII